MNCPCCSGQLLRHIDHRGLYWYCLECRQTMPVLPGRQSEETETYSAQKSRQIWLFIPIEKQKASFKKIA
jgi:hypothetical protein